MKAIDAILENDKNIYKGVLIKTMTLMEIIDDLEEDITKPEGTLEHEIAKKMIGHTLNKFERNIKLLEILVQRAGE